MIAALIKSDTVINMIVLPDDWTAKDGKWQAPEGCEVRMYTKEGEYGMNYKLVRDTFYSSELVEYDINTQQYKLKTITEL